MDNTYEYIIYNKKGEIIYEISSIIKKMYDRGELYVLYDNTKLFYNLGIYYLLEKDYNQSKKYFLKASSDNDNANHELGLYYMYHMKDFNEAKKYLLLAIEKDNDVAINTMGVMHYYEKKYDEAIKYYLMAIEKGNQHAMYNLGVYYQNIEKNNIKAMEYYLMANTEKSRKALKYLDGLKEDKYDQIYENKIKYASKIDYCGVCLTENTKVIMLNCFCHYVCINCYPKIYNKPCPYCRL